MWELPQIHHVIVGGMKYKEIFFFEAFIEEKKVRVADFCRCVEYKVMNDANAGDDESCLRLFIIKIHRLNGLIMKLSRKFW